jgi:CheY-like chemotaxis protein
MKETILIVEDDPIIRSNICDILESPDDKNLQSKIHGEIKELCKSFPAPSELA